MDIVTYAAVNGLSVAEAKQVLVEMAKNTKEVFRVNPSDVLHSVIYPSYDRGHYAGRGAARSVPLAYTNR